MQRALVYVSIGLKRNKNCDFDSFGKLCSERLPTGNEEFWKQNTEPFPRQSTAYLAQKKLNVHIQLFTNISSEWSQFGYS